MNEEQAQLLKDLIAAIRGLQNAIDRHPMSAPTNGQPATLLGGCCGGNQKVTGDKSWNTHN